MMPPAVKGMGALLMIGVLFVVTVEATAETTMNVTTNLDNWILQNMQSYYLKSMQIVMDGGKGSSKEHKETQGEQSKPLVITVRQDGQGDFKKVSDAVKSIPSGNTRRTIIKIGKGVYKERVRVDRSRPYVTFLGDANSMPTISASGTAAKYGTYESATVGVDADNFMAVNIIFENSAPKPKDGTQGQAVAMKIAGDKAAFYNCKFYGYQDTLCDAIGRHYFKNCFIQGTVDFVFGDGRSLYEYCELHSVADGVTAITAQGRSSSSDNSGFSFVNCKVTGTGKAYLSRAWKTNSRVVFANSYLGELVQAKAWDDKGYTSRQKTVYYAEYQCKGPGATTSGRAKYGKTLNSEQAKPFMSKTFVDGNSWIQQPPSL